MIHRLFVATTAAVLLALGSAMANGSDMHFRMSDLPTIDELLAQQQYQLYAYGYPVMTPEGFVIYPGNWWIGNQPYLPYYGYTPSTAPGYPPDAITPYYPPYASGNGGYPNGIPMGYLGGQSVPSPLLASPSVVVPPLLANPVAPPPIEITPLPEGGYSVRRAPNFYLYSVPQYPNFQTSGSAIYPNPQFYYPPYPYYLPIPSRR